jgi:hypothetical protein
MKYHNSNLTDVENVGRQLRRIRKEKRPDIGTSRKAYISYP